MSAWIHIAGPAAAAAIVIALLRRSGLQRHFADHPNERSLHQHPTPRIGGMGLLAAALPFAAFGSAGDAALAAALGCALFLAVVSALDDWRSLPVEVRLPAHAAAALVFLLAAGGNELPGIAVTSIALLAIVWMANLFNFMDGADGLAGGMAVIGFLALSVAAHQAGAAPL